MSFLFKVVLTALIMTAIWLGLGLIWAGWGFIKLIVLMIIFGFVIARFDWDKSEWDVDARDI